MSNTDRNFVTKLLRTKAAGFIDRALDVAATIMEDDKAENTDRLKAVNIFLDRAAGKPSQEVVIDAPDESDMNARFLEASNNAREVMALPEPDKDKADPPDDNVVPIKRRRRL